MPSDDEAEVFSRWQAAFPRFLRSDVRAAVAVLPGRGVNLDGSTFTVGTIDSHRHPGGLVIGGENLEVPYRFYGEALRPADVEPYLSSPYLTPRQRTVPGCMFTRHHNGYVRQRWIREVVSVAEPWVVPFVVALLGEYLVEILVDLHRGLHALDHPESATAEVYRAVLTENPAFLELTRQRVESYWHCYYEGMYLKPADYPGHQVLTRFQRLIRAPLVADGPQKLPPPSVHDDPSGLSG
jgi:hypothetical protein